MATGKPFKINDALYMVKEMDRQYGEKNVLGQKYITRVNFDRYIYENIGMDKSTIYNYLNILKAFNFIRIDPFDPTTLELTYENSRFAQNIEDIKQARLLGFLNDKTHEDSKNE